MPRKDKITSTSTVVDHECSQCPPGEERAHEPGLHPWSYKHQERDNSAGSFHESPGGLDGFNFDELGAEPLCTGGLPLCDPDGSVNQDALAHAMDHVLLQPDFPRHQAEQELWLNEVFATFMAMIAANQSPVPDAGDQGS